MEHLKEFGVRLKDLICEKDTNVQKLSKILGVDASVIHRWCKNSSIPSFKNLIKLANYFECTLDYLLGLQKDCNLSKSKECPPLSSQLKQMMGNLTVYKICKKTGISKYTLTRCLKDDKHPLADNLIKLANFFDCTIDHLIGRES